VKTIVKLFCAALVASALTGCSFKGVNDVPLPLTKGGGADDLRVTVILANATNLVANSEVKYNDITVGSVRKIQFDNWHAKLTVGIEKNARVPANVTAKIAQKSLLGAEYLALQSLAPTSGNDQVRLLRTGDTLGLDRTGRYPETEEVLSAAALLLNNGGLGQLRTITHELNAALDGRTQDVRSVVAQISRFTGTLDQQRDSILGCLQQLDRLSRSVNARHADVERALDALPRGVQVLVDERKDLVRSLEALNSLSTTAHRVLSETTDGLATNLANLRPVTKAVADNAKKLADNVDMISFPFPIKSINRAFYGDYINFFAIMNINAKELAKYWTGGTALEALVAPLLGLPGTTSTGNTNPLTDPLTATPPTTSSEGVSNLLSGLLGGLTAGQSQEKSSTSGSDVADPDGLSSLLGGVFGGGR